MTSADVTFRAARAWVRVLTMMLERALARAFVTVPVRALRGRVGALVKALAMKAVTMQELTMMLCELMAQPVKKHAVKIQGMKTHAVKTVAPKMLAAQTGEMPPQGPPFRARLRLQLRPALPPEASPQVQAVGPAATQTVV